MMPLDVANVTPWPRFVQLKCEIYFQSDKVAVHLPFFSDSNFERSLLSHFLISIGNYSVMRLHISIISGIII
jgi:hypothetical protein